MGRRRGGWRFQTRRAVAIALQRPPRSMGHNKTSGATKSERVFEELIKNSLPSLLTVPESTSAVDRPRIVSIVHLNFAIVKHSGRWDFHLRTDPGEVIRSDVHPGIPLITLD